MVARTQRALASEPRIPTMLADHIGDDDAEELEVSPLWKICMPMSWESSAVVVRLDRRVCVAIILGKAP